jgi:pSer/pThr/pTyr-binding forkhead associated (FHA) protein
LCPADGASHRWTVRSGALVGRGPGTLDLTPLAGGDTVSRRHATFQCAGGEWSIEPAFSTNPTLVNGQLAPIGQRTRIAHGDTLTLGEVTMFFFTSALSRDGGQ